MKEIRRLKHNDDGDSAGDDFASFMYLPNPPKEQEMQLNKWNFRIYGLFINAFYPINHFLFKGNYWYCGFNRMLWSLDLTKKDLDTFVTGALNNEQGKLDCFILPASEFDECFTTSWTKIKNEWNALHDEK